ncbi:hypothetical protein Thermo_00645 [Thermoplasmatales archaeon]|nr:hypothetical protein Thermo_00645 [Thermoplasmatales archaeon]
MKTGHLKLLVLVSITILILFTATSAINLEQKVTVLPLRPTEPSLISELNQPGLSTGFSRIGYLNLTAHGQTASIFYVFYGFHNLTVINATNAHKLQSNPIDLQIYKVNQSFGQPFNNTAISISDFKISSSIAVQEPPLLVGALPNIGMHIYCSSWYNYDDLLLHKGLHSFYLNFTITPYAEMYSYNFPGHALGVSLEWNVTVN